MRSGKIEALVHHRSHQYLLQSQERCKRVWSSAFCWETFLMWKRSAIYCHIVALCWATAQCRNRPPIRYTRLRCLVDDRSVPFQRELYDWHTLCESKRLTDTKMFRPLTICDYQRIRLARTTLCSSMQKSTFLRSIRRFLLRFYRLHCW